MRPTDPARAGWTRARSCSSTRWTALSDPELDAPSALAGVATGAISSATSRAMPRRWGDCWTGRAPASRRRCIRASSSAPRTSRRRRSSTPDALRADVHGTADAFAAKIDAHEAWDARVRTAQGRDIPASNVPWMRTCEVWLHAVDLDAGRQRRRLPRRRRRRAARRDDRVVRQPRRPAAAARGDRPRPHLDDRDGRRSRPWARQPNCSPGWSDARTGGAARAASATAALALTAISAGRRSTRTVSDRGAPSGTRAG